MVNYSKKTIGVLGGDLRIAHLVKLLNDEYNVRLYGLEECELLENQNHIEDFIKFVDGIEIIITSIPLSKNNEFINTPFSKNKILVEELFKKTKNKTIITGNITNEIQKKYIELNCNNKIIDILKSEDLAILNAIPTAEGAIHIAIENSDRTLHNSNCLIMGFGKIGKILSKMLLGIGANVYCEARKASDIALIQGLGYNEILLDDLDKYLFKFDYIFNTIPFCILDKNKLKLIKKDCLIIDLASKPGGIDFEEANKMKIKNIWALALPGKIAPKTAANYLYRTIKKEI